MKQKDINKRTRTADCRRSVTGRLLFLSLLLFTFLGGTRAQETLTVHDGTATNEYVPFYGYYADATQQNQMIYPASELTALVGQSITEMKFYIAQKSGSYSIGNWIVSLGETEATTLSGLDNTTTLTQVYSGTMNFNSDETEMTVTFEDGYTYNGGNLLVEFNHPVADSYKHYFFYGETVTGASYCYSDQRDFLPKTTFTYETPSSCYRPKNLTATLTLGDGTIATLTWERNDNGTEDAWVLQYGTDETFAAGSYTEVQVNTTPSADLTGLTAETTYYARVKANCGDVDGESAWSNVVTFTPTDAYLVTVNDGTNTNGYVPIYGWYADQFSKSQFVIPAADLADMQWGTINKLTFYASNANVSWGAAEFEVYMTEVDYTTFKGTTLVDWTTMDKVMSAGSLSIVDNKMEVTLDAPYQYMGSNLLIGILQTTSGSYVTSNWYGVSQEGTTALGGYEDSKAISSQSFLPKTTFAYIPGEEPTCFKPTNLAVSNISTNSADLSWDGTSDNYVLQYRTAAHDNMNMWEQVGEDVIATATLTQYTFDLSSYSGTGNIAIRHYNISDMFRLAVDDIVVTNANGDEVVSEDFENGSIPSGWTNYDYDGDGYVWNPVSFDSEDIQNGSYCVSSSSWDQNGALTPDNWLIIPDVELGGTLTLYARGVDASFPQENFGVFVTTASLETVFGTTPAGDWSAEIPTTDTSYELTGLTGDMPYEWQVKGVCGEGDESSWASSSFTTLPEGFKTFITAGNWDVADNWYPAGVPTSEDEVSIEAAVTIPAGVVATAKKATLNGGSILIKDGGQLKQGAATLRVTIEKEITGYGEETGKYSFISSPFTGRTLYEASGTWSRVDNLLDGDYDFYAFDSSADLEWINYEANPTHISFESDNGNSGLMYGEGYLYANAEDKTLQFVGTTGKSIDYTETRDVIYDETSTDAFNGWQLVGNFFSCNAYVYFANEDGNLLPATFYKMNADGDGLVKVDGNVVELKPCESAFIVVNASGKIVYSSEPVEADGEVVSVAMLPLLPEHGLDADQDAELFTLTLQNDNEENYPLIMDYHGATVNVALAGRTLWKDGNWNTLCLPFDMTEEQVTEQLAPTELKELDTAEGAYEHVTGLDETTLYLNFKDATTISAGVPYIIKWNGDGTDNIVDPTFGGVTIPDNYDSAEAIADALVDAAVTFEGGQFVGTYSPLSYTEETESILFLGVDEDNNKSKLYWPAPNADNSTVTIGAFRAYFQMNDGAKIRAFRLNFGENGGEATGILSMDNGQLRMENDSWYSVDGRKLLNAPKRKGVYIHNGTKVTIK